MADIDSKLVLDEIRKLSEILDSSIRQRFPQVRSEISEQILKDIENVRFEARSVEKDIERYKSRFLSAFAMAAILSISIIAAASVYFVRTFEEKAEAVAVDAISNVTERSNSAQEIALRALSEYDQTQIQIQRLRIEMRQYQQQVANLEAIVSDLSNRLSENRQP